ncbi:alpha/beta hydrolase [Candidatus Phycosocius spiralis]|uniref:Alpha/beta hydrolase n=1 Tax=Candidatus Phycosocius spiralis TaxID=2815099 RepID=A0ABQ4PXF4_9PROT|nr:alpha/beta hydrolase [Candidatus Phycosocius spiralis]
MSVDLTDGTMAGLVWAPASLKDTPPKLVFLHANGFCASTYRALLSDVALKSGCVIAAYDLRGHGRTTLPADPKNQDNWHGFARDIRALIAKIAPEGVLLAGHSMGGTSALLVCAKNNGLIKGLCLFDPVLMPPLFYTTLHIPGMVSWLKQNFPLAKAAARRRTDFSDRNDAVTAYAVRGTFKSWPRLTLADYCEDGFKDVGDGVTLSCRPAFEAACFAGQRHNPLGALKRLTIPTLIVRASQNSTTHASLLPFLARCGVQVETLPDTNHFLPMLAHDACARIVVDLIHSA